MIGGHPFHVFGLLSHAAKEISAAHDDRNLHAELVNVCKFGRDFVNARSVNAKTLVAARASPESFKRTRLKIGSDMLD